MSSEGQSYASMVQIDIGPEHRERFITATRAQSTNLVARGTTMHPPDDSADWQS
jgi:hypothetical protein